jgi:protein SCO1/2
MPRFVLPILVVAIVGLGLSILGLATIIRRSQATMQPATSRAAAPDDIASGLAIPAFRLTDQDGVSRDESLLDGRLTVVDFIFTNCPFACPIMTGVMHDAAERLKDSPVRFLSISVDPAHDTPARLKEFAAKNACDPARWTFLTGDRAGIERIVKDGLRFALHDDDKTPVRLADGTSMSNVVHPTKLLLIGPDRRVIAFFESSIPEDLDRLVERARRAAKELNPK